MENAIFMWNLLAKSRCHNIVRKYACEDQNTLSRVSIKMCAFDLV